ncbi:MAG: hypothetical protein QXS29_10135 [Nitrososphaeria archaeon]
MSTVFGVFEASPEEYLNIFREACSNLGMTLQGENVAIGQNHTIVIVYKVTALSSTGYRFSGVELTYFQKIINIENDVLSEERHMNKKIIIPTGYNTHRFSYKSIT